MDGRSEYEMFRSSGHQAQTIIQCDGNAASFGQSLDLLLETTFAFQLFSEVERLTLFWKGRITSPGHEFYSCPFCPAFSLYSWVFAQRKRISLHQNLESIEITYNNVS